MKNKIAFFGASVTQQQNGDWQYFANLNPQFDVRPFGNGSMHLNDAGICYIEDVIKFNPQWCFIDWFSTGYIVYGKDKNEDGGPFVSGVIQIVWQSVPYTLYMLKVCNHCFSL